MIAQLAEALELKGQNRVRQAAAPEVALLKPTAPRPIFGSRGQPAPCIDPVLFSLWLETAKPGEWAWYFEGNLTQSRDGVNEYGMPLVSTERRATAQRIGAAAWNAHTAGLVYLFQEKSSKGHRYLALKRHPRSKQDTAWEAFLTAQRGRYGGE